MNRLTNAKGHVEPLHILGNAAVTHFAELKRSPSKPRTDAQPRQVHTTCASLRRSTGSSRPSRIAWMRHIPFTRHKRMISSPLLVRRVEKSLGLVAVQQLRQQVGVVHVVDADVRLHRSGGGPAPSPFGYAEYRGHTSARTSTSAPRNVLSSSDCTSAIMAPV